MAEYRIIESGAFADYEFEASAETLERLFEICAIAAFEAMADLSRVKPIDQYNFTLEAENTPELLFAFLAELIYLKDVEFVLLNKFNIVIENGVKLSCRARGEHINPQKHDLRTDVKAVTYHNFKLEKTKTGYCAHVILDL